MVFLTEKEPKRKHLLSLLNPIKYQWNVVASQLDVPNGKIKDAEYNITYNDTQKLMEILQMWIDMRCSEVSWGHILTVIAAPPLKNITVANDIREFLNKPDIQSLYCRDQSSKYYHNNMMMPYFCLYRTVYISHICYYSNIY